MATEKRENGFYWVKEGGTWYVAFYDNDNTAFSFNDDYYDDDFFEEINENRIKAPDEVEEKQNKYNFARELLISLKSALSERVFLFWLDKLIKDEKEEFGYNQDTDFRK